MAEPVLAGSGAPPAPGGDGAGAPAGAGGGSGVTNGAPAQSAPPAPLAPANDTGTLASGAEVKAPTAPPTWPDDWRQKLAGDDKAYLKTLERFPDPTALAKSYRELQTKQGSMKMPAPANDAKPEEIAAWRKENGIPEAATGYVEKVALPNGMVLCEADKPIVGKFAERAFSLNMPPDQFNGMVSQYYEMLDDQAKERAANDNNYKLEAQDTLNKEWGADYRGNINAVTALMNSAPADVKDRLFAGRTADGHVIGNDPATLRWLAGLSREINPMAAALPGGGGDAMKMGEARIGEIEALMRSPDAQEKYWKQPGVQEEYRKLLTARDAMKARG